MSTTEEQKREYLKIVDCLWTDGPEATNAEYPQLSIQQLKTANAYYDSLRCEGCYCGYCVNLPELASNLESSPEELKPIANLAIKLAQPSKKKSLTISRP